MDLEEALAQAETYSSENEVLVIDNNLRTITIPSSITIAGVESDEDVRRLNFQMPAQYGEVDLSEFNVRINYLNANGEGDKYAVTDKAVSGDNITFSWLIGRNALKYRGFLRFIVCLRKADSDGNPAQEFNTTPAQLPVLEGLETTEAVVQNNPDIIEQILLRLDSLEESGGGPSSADLSELKSQIGDLSDLTTTDKSSLVAAINEAAQSGGGSGGMSSAASALLITVLRNAVYSSDQSGNITALESALAAGSSGDDTGDTGAEMSATYSGNTLTIANFTVASASFAGNTLTIQEAG